MLEVEALTCFLFPWLRVPDISDGQILALSLAFAAGPLLVEGPPPGLPEVATLASIPRLREHPLHIWSQSAAIWSLCPLAIGVHPAQLLAAGL